MPAPAGCRPRSPGSLCTAAKAGEGWPPGMIMAGVRERWQRSAPRAAQRHKGMHIPQQERRQSSSTWSDALPGPAAHATHLWLPRVRVGEAQLAVDAADGAEDACRQREAGWVCIWFRRSSSSSEKHAQGGSCIKPCMAGSVSHATNRSCKTGGNRRKTEGNRHQADLHSRPGGTAAAGT